MAQFTQPLVGANVTLNISSSQWMSVGQVVYHSNGGYYRVIDKPTLKSVTLLNLGYPGNTNPGALVENTGAQISPGGVIGPTPEHVVEQFVLSPTDISNGFLILQEEPKNIQEVVFEVQGGPVLRNGDDYAVDGSNHRRVVWSGYALNGLLSIGDAVTVRYSKKYVYP